MPAMFSIRRARPSDLVRILEIENASFRKDAYDRKLFAEYLRKCGGLFLVALGRRDICGYIVTCTRGALPRAEVISIAIEPEARQKGAASALLRSTLRRLRLRGVHRVDLMVKVTNRKARRFYEKFGFTSLRLVPEYYEDGRDAICMSREV